MTINHPNFFIIGVPNAGTTSLWYLLKQHPEVFMSEVKEPRFFSRNNYQNYFPWYKSLFRNVTTEKAVGESSINYCETHLFESVPERIHQFNPAAKLIYVVRDPVSRVNSCWRQALSTGHWYKYFYHSKRMEKTFEKAIFEYPHFFKTTQYYNNLSSFKKYFNKRQIKVIFFEDFKENTLDTVQDIFTFLEVDSTFVPKDIDKPRNVGVSKK